MVDGLAVYDGDIIIGPAKEVAASPQGSASPKSSLMPWLERRDVSATEDENSLWPNGRIPYVIDSSVVQERENLDRAIDLWNSKTVIKLVPRTTEPDYVRFSAENRGCRAHIGAVGGEQVTTIGNCAFYGIVHEIGHNVGLYHPHERVDRDQYIMFEPGTEQGQAVTPASGPYDYRSNMHWPYEYFETIPPGMPFASSLSPGDIDGVARLYGRPPTVTTISTNPAGLEVIVDGERVTAPATVEWSPGSTHVLEVPLSPQQQESGSGDRWWWITRRNARYLFGRWSDGGSRRHTVTADPGTTWYQASFVEIAQPVVRLVAFRNSGWVESNGRAVVSVMPEVGEIRADQKSPVGYSVRGTPTTLEARPAPGSSYRIGTWYSFLDRAYLSASARQVVRTSRTDLVIPYFSKGPFLSIESNEPAVPTFLRFLSSNRGHDLWTPVELDPNLFGADEILELAAPETLDHEGTRFRFENWGDGGDDERVELGSGNSAYWARSRRLEFPSDGGAIQLNYSKKHLLSALVIPRSSGHSVRISPQSDDGYYDPGTLVRVTASPSREFLRWEGDVSGTASQAIVVMDRPKTVHAVFSPGSDDSGQSIPQLLAYPRAFTFVTHEGFGTGPHVVQITNETNDPLTFQVKSNRNWMTAGPTEGTLLGGETHEIAIRASGAELGSGIRSAEISIISALAQSASAGMRSVRLPVHHITLPAESQVVDLTGGSSITLTQYWDGQWRIGTNIVESGYRHVDDGKEYVLKHVDGRWKQQTGDATVVLGASGQTAVIEVFADNSSYLDGELVGPGSQVRVTAANGDVYGLTKDSKGMVVATFVPRTQSLTVSEGVDVLLAQDREGNEGWRIGVNRVKNGHRYVHGGNEFVLELINGHWRLARYLIRTVAGNSELADGIPGVDASLDSPYGVAVDTDGNVYVSETEDHRVRKIDPSGIITTLAGSRNPGSSGDGGPAAQAQLFGPSGIAVDEAGNVYVAEYYGSSVRKIDVSGTITALAGERFRIDYKGVAVDTAGNVYFASSTPYHSHAVRKIDVSGTIIRLAGTAEGRPGYSGDGGPATQAQLNNPQGVAVDSAGNVYVADASNRRIRKIDTSGTITTLAGTGEYGHSGDGGPATEATFRRPADVVVDTAGNVYVADISDHRIRKIGASGTISTIAGTGEYGHSGDGRPATEAQLLYPRSVAVDTAGNVYIVDSGNERVRKIDSLGIISTLAGAGDSSYPEGSGPVQAESVSLASPRGAALDSAGNLYFVDDRRLWKLAPDETIAVTSMSDIRFDTFSGGVASDAVGNVYVANYLNHSVKKIDASGTISFIAGTGRSGYSGDGGLATEAQLSLPRGVAVDSIGNVYVADSGNSCVRKIDVSGTITTLAGPKIVVHPKGGGPATETYMFRPRGVAVNAAGNVYVGDSYGVFKIDASGTISMLADSEDLGGFPPEISAVAVDESGNVYVGANHAKAGRIWRIEAENGGIEVIAGNGEPGFEGEGVPAGDSRLWVSGIAVDRSGNLWFTDEVNRRVRVLERLR